MTIPAHRDVDLALLLELVRRNGTARPAEVYAPVAAHFPDLTPEDLAQTRKDGRTKVFTNIVHWARDHLRRRSLLDTAVPAGQWTLLDGARETLIQDILARRSLQRSRVETFVDGSQPLPEILGPTWARPLRAIPDGKKKVSRTSVSPPLPEPAPAPSGPLSQDDIKRELMRRLEALDGYAFEQFVGRVLDSLGFTDTRVTSPSGDGGVDVLTYLDSPLIRAKVAVQIKRQKGNVGPKEISYLRDRWGRRSDRLLFITTSDYTFGAREVAEDKDDLPVELINGEQLIQTMIDHGIGVNARPIMSYEVDEEYFEGA